jgi:predicted transcriptional regulator
MADADQTNLTTLTVDLLSAYVANNNVEHGAIPELIKSTHAALKVIDLPEPPASEEPKYEPAVSVRKSLGSDTHIISLIDGKSYQTLKRHLSKHGLTPAQYRERYSLPATYPMVAKSYSESRRAIAEKLGLGRRVTGAQTPAAGAEPAGAPAIEAPAAKKAAPAKATEVESSRASTTAAPKPDKVAAAKPKAPGRAKAAAAPATIAAPIAKILTKAKATQKPKASVAPAGVETPIADAPTKPASKARKAPAPKQSKVTVTTAPAKPARKRATKAAEPAG